MKRYFKVLLSLVVIMFFVSCNNGAKPVISKTATDNNINFEFEELNEAINGTLNLEAEDTIETVIDVKKGSYSIKVEGDNKEVPYEGNSIKNGQFTFKVPKKGAYTFTLKGEKASGNIGFKKIISGEEDKEKKDSAEIKSKESEDSKEKKPEVKSNNSHGKANKNEDKNTVIVEGTSESIETEVKKSNFGYTITYDKNRFKFQNGEGVDTFMAPNSDSSIYPNVFLSVAKIEGQSLDEIMKGLMLQAGQDGVWQNTTIGQGKYKAKKFTFREGNNYNSRVCEYYLTEKDKKVYLIEINYFVEAEEGYGARLHGMLGTFTLN